MKEITLAARVRDKSGKGVARKLRAAGKIPGVVYGKDENPTAIEMEYNDFHTAMKNAAGENLLVNLNLDGSDSGKKAIIKELQRDPVSGHLIHIDFLHISMTEKIKVTIPIFLEGVADGVKNFGGIVSWVIRSIEVSCLPKDIPDKITLDITDLKIHDSIHIRDIELKNVEPLDNPERTVVSIIPPTVVKEEVPAEGEEGAVAAAPAAEEGAEPEVISEKKVEQRQSGKDDKKGKEEKK